MPRRKDHTREELKIMALNAARSILNDQGPSDLTAREIARQIGYTVGTLYNVFTNFNDIILHLNAQTMDEMYEVFVKSNSVKDLTLNYIKFAHEHAALWQLLFESRTHTEVFPDWYQHKIIQLFKLVEQILLPYLNHSQEQASQAAKTLWASLYGICVLSIAGKVQKILNATAESLGLSLVENYLKGITQHNFSF